MRRFVGLICVFALITACQRRPDPLHAFPRVVLWAWERADDLRFIDRQQTGIAFLARTIDLHDGEATVRPRVETVRFPSSTALMAVVRVESIRPPLPRPAIVASEIATVARLDRVRAVQIDFDARKSERGWYADVIHQVRSSVGTHIALSITALASWCEDDPWIRDLPVDDAVPMLFRMGAGERWTGPDFSVPLCRSSVGLSTDELPDRVPPQMRGRRLFVFHPASWSPDSYRGVNQVARRW